MVEGKVVIITGASRGLGYVSTLMPGPINTTILGGDPSRMNCVRPEDIATMIVYVLSLQKSIEVRGILMQP